MKLHEQIYTSAPRLLEGGGNLGVVAETRDFPRALSPQLAAFRAYTILDRYDLATPASHPPRLVLGPVGDGSVYALTRTVFAGADHTGRTTPLAHHVVVDIASARRERAGVAEFLTAALPVLRSSWPDEPRWIDPPHDLPPATPPAAPAAWQPVLPWLAGALIDFARTGRAAVVVIDPDTAADVPAGLAAVLALLPPSLQWSTTVATHAVAVGDFVREAGLIVTYPAAPLLEQCRQRRDSRAPIIFDLTSSTATPTQSAGAWGDLLRRAATPEAARRFGERFDAFGLSADDVPAFARTATLVGELAAAPTQATGEDWKALAARVAEVSDPAALVGWIAETATHAVRTLAADEGSATRWQTLAAVTANPAWPDVARQAAAGALLDGGADALDAAAEVVGPSDAAAAIFRPAVQARPALPFALLANIADADPAATRRAAFVLAHAVIASRDNGRRAVEALFAAPPAARQHLRPAIVQALAAGLHDADDIVSLAAAHADARRAIVMPVLRQRLRMTHDGSWQTLEARYRDVAIAGGLRPEDYIELFREFGPSMRRGIDGWLNHPNLNPSQKQDLRAAAERAGLVAPQRPPQPPPITTDINDIRPVTPTQDGAGGRSPRRVSAGSAGPIRVGLYLSLLVVFACCVSALVLGTHGHGRDALRRPELLFALACVGLWAMSEVFLRMVVRSPQQFAIARWGRWLIVGLLLIAIAVAIWPTLTYWKPSLADDIGSTLGLARSGGGRAP